MLKTTAGRILLILLIGSLVSLASAEPVISFDPDTLTMYPESTAQVTIVLSEAPQGLAGYELTLGYPSSVISVSDVVFPTWATLKKQTAVDSGITLSGVDLNRVVQAGTTNVELATITVKGSAIGAGKISISGIQMDADGGVAISPTLGSLDVSVLTTASKLASTTTTTTATTVVTTVTTYPTATTVTTIATPTPTPTSKIQAVATLQHNDNGQVLSTIKTVPKERNSQTAPSVTIDKGTIAKDNNGQPLSSVYVSNVEADQYTAPVNTRYSAPRQVIQCGPEGATFDPPATVSFTLSETEWADVLNQAGGNADAITIMYFDPAINAWSEMPTNVDLQTRTLTTITPHFSTFGVFVNKTGDVSGEVTPATTSGNPDDQTPVAVLSTTATTAPRSSQKTPVPTNRASAEIATPILTIALAAIGGVYRKKRT